MWFSNNIISEDFMKDLLTKEFRTTKTKNGVIISP